MCCGVVERRHQHVVDRLSEVEADEVGLLERPEHRQAGAEAVLDDVVDRLRVADAGRDERDRLALHRVLQAVADEARDVAVDEDGMAADRRAG